MADYVQGDDYEEELIDDDELVDEEESDVVYTSFFGIPKNIVYIGAVVLILLIIFLFLFLSKEDNKSNEVEEESTEALFDYNPDAESQDELFDYVEPAVQEVAPVEEVYYDMEDLSTEDIIKLRAYGYTGDEIEYSINHGFSVDMMVERAQSRIDAINEESWLRTSDVAGDEYKYLMDMTYLGQESADPIINQEELDWSLQRNSTQDVVINCDYEKCPTQGMQLYLKCRIAKNTYYWYPVTPQRWCTLPDKGNIVLRITFNLYGDGTYIVSATETDSTLDTIDSSNDIEDVTDGTASEQAQVENAEDAFLTGDAVPEDVADDVVEDSVEDVEEVAEEDEVEG